MGDITFMENKFSIDSFVTHYLEDIKNLRSYIETPSDETKLQMYHQAANNFKKISTKDIMQFVTAYKGNLTGKPAAMRDALPLVLGDRINQPSKLDMAYLHLLLEYVTTFKKNRSNIKDWLLKFLLSSQFSPLYTYVEKGLNQVIANTERKIVVFQPQQK